MALLQLPRTRAGRHPAAGGPAPVPRWRPNNRPALSSTTPGRWGGGGRREGGRSASAGPGKAASPSTAGEGGGGGGRAGARPRRLGGAPSARRKERGEEAAGRAGGTCRSGRLSLSRQRPRAATPAPAALAPPRQPGWGRSPGGGRPTNRRADGWPRWARIGSLRPRWAGRAGAAGAATSTGLRFSNADGAGAAVGGRAGRCGDRWPVRGFLGVRRREVRVPELGSQLRASAAADESGRIRWGARWAVGARAASPTRCRIFAGARLPASGSASGGTPGRGRACEDRWGVPRIPWAECRPDAGGPSPPAFGTLGGGQPPRSSFCGSNREQGGAEAKGALRVLQVSPEGGGRSRGGRLGKSGPGVRRGAESAGCGSAGAPPPGEPGLTASAVLRLAV